MELYAKTVYGGVMALCYRPDSCLRMRKITSVLNGNVNFFTTIVLGDHDFPLTASNFGNLTPFRAIFGHMFTAHAQKRLFMNFRLKV